MTCELIALLFWAHSWLWSLQLQYVWTDYKKASYRLLVVFEDLTVE